MPTGIQKPMCRHCLGLMGRGEDITLLAYVESGQLAGLGNSVADLAGLWFPDSVTHTSETLE